MIDVGLMCSHPQLISFPLSPEVISIMNLEFIISAETLI